MRVRICSIEDIGIGGRHCQSRQPAYGLGIANRMLVLADIDPASPAPRPADR